MEETQANLLIVGFVFLLFVGAMVGSYYVNNKMRYDNFQATIKDLSSEQKCIHICGFQWDNVLENYKFCMEKCDRISERTMVCETK